MPQTSICLICLVGLPASGKTTLAHNIKAKYQMRYNVDIISFDIEISQDGDMSWKNKRSAVHCSVKLLIQKYLTSSDKHTLIVLDDNMFYKSMRYEYFQLARKYSLGFCEIYLSSPLEMCLKLNKQRANQVADSTIIKMNALLEVPDSSANNWETNIVILTNQSLSPDDWLNVENTLHKCLLTPVKDFPRLHKEDIPQSILHLVDIALRKIVNALIIKRKETYGVSKLYNLELLKKRQQILNSVRAGEIVLPETYEENCIVLYSEHLQKYF
uniref:Putative conserved secreted protein n=1 Tax=Panstrongylus lignarius TaxID=156445 RepID=A0A224XVN3_9HEMI